MNLLKADISGRKGLILSFLFGVFARFLPELLSCPDLYVFSSPWRNAERGFILSRQNFFALPRQIRPPQPCSSHGKKRGLTWPSPRLFLQRKGASEHLSKKDLDTYPDLIGFDTIHYAARLKEGEPSNNRRKVGKKLFKSDTNQKCW